MRRNDPRIEIGDISTLGRQAVAFMVRDIAQVDAAVERVRTLTQGVGIGGQRDWNVAVQDDSTRIVLTPTKAGLDRDQQRDGSRDRGGPQAHRRTRHARADDHPRGR
jgi:preprotein translocase subunit SecD